MEANDTDIPLLEKPIHMVEPVTEYGVPLPTWVFIRVFHVFIMLLGFGSIGAGIYLLVHECEINTGAAYCDITNDDFLPFALSAGQKAAIVLSITVMVTICTEVTGFVHNTVLKTALARQGKLEFNANLGLFT